jgi:hypothetical protein
MTPQSTVSLDGVLIDEACAAGALVNGHTGALQMIAKCRMCTHVLDDLTHPIQQPGILKYRLAHGDAIAVELPSFSHQPGGMCKCSHGDWSVIGSHSPKLLASDKAGLGTQVCRSQRGDHSRRPCADNNYVCHVGPPTSVA